MFERLTDAVKTLLGSKAQPMRESAGTNIDTDEEGWRKLSGDSNRDLSPLTQARQQELALYLWRTNPLGNRLVELPVAYMLAESITLSVPDKEAQGWIDKFWKDPINNMDIKLPKKLRELSIYGEQCWPVFVNHISGHVRLGYLDPARIESVITDPDNAEQAIGIVARSTRRGGSKLRYRVIINGPEEVFSERTQKIRGTFTDGECFYFCINDLSNSTRGHSDLLHVMDWLDVYDKALYGELARWEAMRAFLWDVTLRGATPEEVEKRAKEIDVPTSGGIRVHNDAETWTTESPDLKAADGAEFARLFRNHVLGGLTVPEHWFGGGGDVNRSTAGSMDEPTAKIFSLRQRLISYILASVGQYAVNQRYKAILGSLPDPEEDNIYQVSAVCPEMIVKDSTAYAAALQQVVIAVDAAVSRGFLSRESGTRLICVVASRLGVEVDADAELEKVQAAGIDENGDLTDGLDENGMPLSDYGTTV